MSQEKVLQGITHNSIQYCVTSVIESYLKYYGIDLMTDILGRYWGLHLLVKPSRELFRENGDYRISPVPNSYTDILKECCGISLKNVIGSWNKEEFISCCKRYINQGYPLIVNADPYYFENYENYYHFHGLNWNHYILVYGYSDTTKRFIYLDSTRTFVNGAIHTISYEELYESVFGEINIYGIEPEMCIMEKPETVRIFHQNTFDTGYIKVNRKEQYKEIYHGKEAMEELAKVLREEAYLQNENEQKLFMDSLLNQVVLMVQHRKANLSYSNKYIHRDIETLNQIIKHWNMVKFSLSPVRKKKNKDRFLDSANYIDILSELEMSFEDDIGR